MSLTAKTYDLKSAYRQVPVREDDLKFGYFCIYNHETDEVELYRSRTLPFGATHSVFNFLRLARMIHHIACRGAYLLTTNFYDDFILASNDCLRVSSKNCMELIFFSLVGSLLQMVRRPQRSQKFAALWASPST